jgi:hypothetical protein
MPFGEWGRIGVEREHEFDSGGEFEEADANVTDLQPIFRCWPDSRCGSVVQMNIICHMGERECHPGGDLKHSCLIEFYIRITRNQKGSQCPRTVSYILMFKFN